MRGLIFANWTSLKPLFWEPLYFKKISLRENLGNALFAKIIPRKIKNTAAGDYVRNFHCLSIIKTILRIAHLVFWLITMTLHIINFFRPKTPFESTQFSLTKIIFLLTQIFWRWGPWNISTWARDKQTDVRPDASWWIRNTWKKSKPGLNC